MVGSMLGVLFAIRTVIWVILILVAVGLAVWFVVRVIADFTEWFREEILPDFRQRQSKSKESPEAEGRAEDEQPREPE